ncbi:hypothetical protein FQA39_LY04217 [Lamprigera yunnana]|nr:hypothetical protein FQA39_LY04217 [Lamprigera yunnana]
MDKDKNTSRKRSINFQLIEIRTLVDLVLQYKNVIENKKSDAVIWQEMKSVWTGIANKFNATCGVQPRTAESNISNKFFKIIEHVEPTVEAVPSCSNTNNINAEQQQTALKRKWSPHDLKCKKTGTLHVKKYNASVQDKFTKLAEDKTELVKKLQFETEQAHLQFKHNKHKLKMQNL